MAEDDTPRVQVRTEDVSWREVDGEIIALDLRASTYFTTNRAGAVLWHRMVEGCPADQLAELLCERFGIDGARAEADVHSFLRLLKEHDLLIVEG